MSKDTYYRDHWIEIPSERLDLYEQMFSWRPEMEPLVTRADLKAGQVVVDYGCGPGGLMLELARRIGPEGHVHGVDLNAELAVRARTVLAREGFEGRTSVHYVSDDRVPLEDVSVDRLICKNVLEYVPEVAAALAEFHRVLKPGGIAHLIDSDWGMLLVEPLGADKLEQLIGAAGVAFRTPRIGRSLRNGLKMAGFKDLSVSILAGVDTAGRLLPVLSSMATYAEVGGLDRRQIDALLAEIEASIAGGSYMACLPQFTATGVKPTV